MSQAHLLNQLDPRIVLLLVRLYWRELALFSGIFAALVLCCTPDVTWAALDYDLFDFLYSSTYLNVGHASGFPLYTILGWLAVRLPVNSAWSMAFFLSVVPTMVTCGLIFWIVRKKTENRWAPYLGAMAFAGAQVVFSQAIIPEIYSLVTMFMVLAYVLLETGRKGWAVLALGLGCAVHYLAIIMVPIVMWRYGMWRVWGRQGLKPWLALLPGLALYIYLPLANSWPHMSMGPTSLNNMWSYFIYHESMLLNIPIWWLPQRLGEGVVVIGASLGLALVLVVLGMLHRDGRTLFWLAIPGVIFYITTLGPTAYVHMTPAFAFGAIAAGMATGRLPVKLKLKPLVPAALMCSVLLLATNAWFYDVGRTLDPAPTGARSFLNQLEEVEDGALVVCWDAVTFAGVYWYNEKYDRELRPIHPIFINPEVAHDWEFERERGLDFSKTGGMDFPPPSDDWLTDFNEWCRVNTQEFVNNNPNEVIYAVYSDTTDRTRRNVQLELMLPEL